MGFKAAIIHYTNKSEKRPKIYKDQIKKLEDYAVSLGFEVAQIFCDMSLKRSERTEFDHLLSNCNQYDAVIAKDFHHISPNTMMCFKILQTLKEHHVKVFTTENGIFSWDDPPLDNNLKVASYCCRFGPTNEMKEIIAVQNDIFKLFVKKKTNWSLINQYFDESEQKRGDAQIQLMKLIQNKDKYDLILVSNLNNLHYRTSKFCKIRQTLHMDICSLEEGYFKYEENTT